MTALDGVPAYGWFLLWVGCAAAGYWLGKGIGKLVNWLADRPDGWDS